MVDNNEKMWKELQLYLASNNERDITGLKDSSKNIATFLQEHNPRHTNTINPAKAKTSEDFLHLALQSFDERLALKYAKKALKLDNENLEAELIVASLKSDSPHSLIKNLESVIKHGNQILTEKGFFDSDYIGQFGEIPETIPYMSVRLDHALTLKGSNMLHRAAEQFEDMIRLNPSDPMDLRFELLPIYVQLEDEEKALALHKRFRREKNTVFLFFLSLLYFKLGNFRRSLAYLKDLQKINPSAKKFFKEIAVEGAPLSDLDGLFAESSEYKANSYEDFYIQIASDELLIMSNVTYFEWAYAQLKKKK